MQQTLTSLSLTPPNTPRPIDAHNTGRTFCSIAAAERTSGGFEPRGAVQQMEESLTAAQKKLLRDQRGPISAELGPRLMRASTPERRGPRTNALSKANGAALAAWCRRGSRIDEVRGGETTAKAPRARRKNPSPSFLEKLWSRWNARARPPLSGRFSN
jgi:hypothetical protein